MSIFRLFCLFPFPLLLLLVAGCGDYRALNEQNTYYQKGEAARQEKNWQKASYYYRKCLEFSPKSWQAHLQLALIAEEHEHDLPKAIVHYREYLKLGGPEKDRVEKLLEDVKTRYVTASIREVLFGASPSSDGENGSVPDLSGLRELLKMSGLKEPLAVIHRVRPGESPVVLAQHYYGDRKMWRSIFDFNQQYTGRSDIFQEGRYVLIPLIEKRRNESP